MSDVECPKCVQVSGQLPPEMRLCSLCDWTREVSAEDSATFTLMGPGAGRNRWLRARRRRLGWRDFGLLVEEATAAGEVRFKGEVDG